MIKSNLAIFFALIMFCSFSRGSSDTSSDSGNTTTPGDTNESNFSAWQAANNKGLILKECQEDNLKITAAEEKCQEEQAAGDISNMDAAALISCKKALDCDQLWKQVDPNSDLSDEGDLKDIIDNYKQATHQSIIPVLNPDMIKVDDDGGVTFKTPDKGAAPKCTALSVQKQLDMLHDQILLDEKSLGKANSKIADQSIQMDQSVQQTQDKIASLTTDLQKSEIDRQSGPEEAVIANLKANTNAQNQLSGIEQRIDDVRQDEISLSSGSKKKTADETYQNALSAALGQCQASLALLMSKGQLNLNSYGGSNLSAEASLAFQNQGQINPNNPFSRGGAITQNYCSVNNTYLAKKEAAYRDYIANLASLRELAQKAAAEERSLVRQETIIMANMNTAQMENANITQKKLATDSANIANNTKQLNDLTAQSYKLNSTIGNSMQTLEATRDSQALDLAKLQYELAVLTKVAGHGPNNNPAADPDAEKDANISKIVSDGAAASMDEAKLKSNGGQNNGPSCSDVIRDSLK